MRRSFHLVMLAAIASAPWPTLAQTPAQRAELTALSSRWHTSFSADEVAPLLARDFQRPMANGRIWSRDDQLAALRALPAAPAGFSTRFDQFDLRFYGDVAIATGIASLINASGAVVDRNVFTDIFAHREGRWLMVNAQRTQVQERRP